MILTRLDVVVLGSWIGVCCCCWEDRAAASVCGIWQRFSVCQNSLLIINNRIFDTLTLVCGSTIVRLVIRMKVLLSNGVATAPPICGEAG